MAVETAPLPAITVHSGYMRAKRIIDVVFTLLIFIPLCLVIAVVAVCIRLDSEGPVFFRQKRVGLNGKEFTMIKLRSMYVQSDDTIHREAIQRYMNGETLDGGSYKLKHDPRVTRVGRFIRKTSIDELPQFFNVLRGEMTLVGPRPPLPYEVEEYGSREWGTDALRRHCVGDRFPWVTGGDADEFGTNDGLGRTSRARAFRWNGRQSGQGC